MAYKMQTKSVDFTMPDIENCHCGHRYAEHTYFPARYPCRACGCQQFAERFLRLITEATEVPVRRDSSLVKIRPPAISAERMARRT